MSQPFVGEIRMFAGTYAPLGWELCDGRLLPIAENEVLFQLIGTTYGGDGEDTFALPDLRGRVPVHVGPGYVQAQSGGVESVVLTVNQIPNHTHALVASTDLATLASPSGTVTGQAASKPYRVPGATTQMNAAMLVPAGGSQPHDNMQPYLAVNYIISMFGLYPFPS